MLEFMTRYKVVDNKGSVRGSNFQSRQQAEYYARYHAGLSSREYKIESY
jgi:hypothetical protein